MPSTAIPSLGESIGALYLGSNIASILYGITNLQGLSYYKRYPNDWWVYRYSVTLLWVLDTLHVALSTHALYFYLITMFGNLVSDLESDLWSMKWQLYLNDLIVVYVQGLYAVRLWKLGRHFHKILPWFVAFAVIASLGSTIYVVHSIHITPNLASASNIKRAICAFFSTIAATDVIIAIPMTYYLHRSRGRIILSSKASSVLLRLMRLVLVSGLVTSACSLLTLISYVVWPDSLIFLGINFVLSKIYINSLLAMLNSRSENQPASRTTEGGANLLPTVLQITPHSSEGNSAETNIGISLQRIGSLSDKLDHSKEDLDCQV
ncbi:hypothetical protein IW261DRAFT_1451267 [Armillaria novae-zelandiae]|uniref:DUF6534 domain-containing protein n=1 Tax=Armillaria novae-zelandiae TaxID=153914 RepID=A0AA39UG40_9AGAR|nr:hypothetical protein IW261DRAFT_1451267 [Armillaria novae-zelandiae]